MKISKRMKKLTGVSMASIALLLGGYQALNIVTAHAQGPVTVLNKAQLNHFKFDNRKIPQTYHGIWYYAYKETPKSSIKLSKMSINNI
ncbi:hypothetical protein MOO46_03725 [Apilactobacillus apisilvae]|uniref:Uncharacterized protein n=1 Tax=Apilactobacillus apisilvae TaxID=2923364 RepID=A0ABY4PIL9_9LACO|nr:hypothetical protein [Apilactobacillus apisilvae]UQS85670.1 hypothetical protein MOO46_03725 [Apilactobacillus apisilvae]